MNKNFEEIIEKYRRHVHDENIEEVIHDLHAEGLTITDSMKAVRILYGVNLGEAKKLVTAHPVWSSVVHANEPLHDVLEQCAISWSNDDVNAANTVEGEKND